MAIFCKPKDRQEPEDTKPEMGLIGSEGAGLRPIPGHCVNPLA
jgi:hypothetical protein